MAITPRSTLSQIKEMVRYCNYYKIIQSKVYYKNKLQINFLFGLLIICFQVFQSNTNNLHTVLWFQVFLSNTNNLHIVVWFQVFQSNTNNLYILVWFQVFLSNADNYMVSSNNFYSIIIICLHTVIQFQVTNNHS